MSNSHTPLSRSNPEKTGYAEYDAQIASMADDGYGAASRSPNYAYSTDVYCREHAMMDDDGFGCAPRG